MKMGIGGPTLAIDQTTGILTWSSDNTTKNASSSRGRGKRHFWQLSESGKYSTGSEDQWKCVQWINFFKFPDPSTWSRSRSSIDAFCRTMGNLCRHLHSRSNSQRILSGVQGTGVIHTSMLGSIEKVCVVEKEILTVVEECHGKSSRKRKIVWFLQNNFLTNKTSGGWRLILNLSNLNLYLQNGNPTINYN